jgi:hypothetical protein
MLAPGARGDKGFISTPSYAQVTACEQQLDRSLAAVRAPLHGSDSAGGPLAERWGYEA